MHDLIPCRPRWIALAALLHLTCACAAPEPDLPVEPVPFVIEAEEGIRDLEEKRKTISCIFRHYRRLFGIDRDEMEILYIRYDGEDAPYESHEYPALYLNATGSIHFRRKPDCMLLLHEIAHHFIRSRFENVPLWLNEGLATYLGWSAMDAEQLVVGEIPVVHFKMVRRMEREGTLLPLETFFKLTPSGFYEGEDNRRHYSQAWGVVFYLLHAHLPPDLPFRHKVQRITAMDPAELAALETAFRRFCRTFSAERMMRERLTFGPRLRRLSSAFRLGLLQDDAAMEALMASARDRRAEVSLRVVALHAGAMIALASPRWAVQDSMMRTLRMLKFQSPPELREAARHLYEAFQRGDQVAIMNRFASQSRDACFYPASRIFMVTEESLGPRSKDLASLAPFFKR